MRIGDQNAALAALPEPQEKLFRACQVADPVLRGAFDGGDVESELTRPMVDAIPLQRPVGGREACPQQVERVPRRQSMQGSVVMRNEFLPEPIVEAQIEQRAIHVEKHGIDLRPVECRCGLLMPHLPYDSNR